MHRETVKLNLYLLYFDFTGAADPVFFLIIFLYESRIVRQRVLHSSTVKNERKYLSAAKSSFFKSIVISVVITNICINSPGHWDTYDYCLIVITDFWILGSRRDR